MLLITVCPGATTTLDRSCSRRIYWLLWINKGRCSSIVVIPLLVAEEDEETEGLYALVVLGVHGAGVLKTAINKSVLNETGGISSCISCSIFEEVSWLRLLFQKVPQRVHRPQLVR